MSTSKKSGVMRSFFRWLIVLITVVITLVVVAMLVLPSILSSRWARQQLIEAYNQRMPGTIHVDAIQLHWLGHQAVEGLEIRNEDGDTLVSIPHLSMEVPLWKLLRPCPSIGYVKVQTPEITIKTEKRALPKPPEVKRLPDKDVPTKPSLPEERPQRARVTPSQRKPCCAPVVRIPFVGKLEISGGTIRFEDADIVPMVIKDLDILVSIEKRRGPVIAKISGTTQKDRLLGTFHLDGMARGFDNRGRFPYTFSTEQGLILSKGSELTLSGELSHFPTEILDRMLGFEDSHGPGPLSTLLGESLSITIDESFTPSGFGADLAVKATNLSAVLVLQSTTERLTLQQPGTLSLTLTPDVKILMQRFYGDEALIALTYPTTLNFQLDRLDLPLPPRPFTFSEMSLLGRFNIEAATLTLLPKGEKVFIKSFEGAINTLDATKLITLDIDAQATYNGKPATLAIHGRLEDAIDERGTYQPEDLQAYVSVEAKELPINLIDTLVGADGQLMDTLGSALNANSSTIIRQGKGNAKITINSDRVHIPNLALTIDEDITLDQPIAMTIKPASTWVRKFFDDTSPIRWPASFPINVSLNQFVVPHFKNSGRLNFEDIVFNARCSFDPIKIEAIPRFGDLKIGQLDFTIEGDNLAHATITSSGALEAAKVRHPVGHLLGNGCTWNTTALLAMRSLKTINIEAIKSVINADHFDVAFEGKASQGIFTMTTPLIAHYTFTPELLQKLEWTKAGQPTLQEPAMITFTIEPMAVPTAKFTLNALQCKGNAVIEKLVIAGGKLSAPEILENNTLSWNLDSIKNQGTLSFNAEHADKDARLFVKTSFSKWLHDGKVDPSETTIEATAQLENAPITPLAVIGGRQELSTLLGTSLTLNLQGRLRAMKEGFLDMTFNGDGLGGKTHLQLKNGAVTLSSKEPSSWHWTVTPDRYAALHYLTDSDLAKKALQKTTLLAPATVEVVVEKVRIPLDWMARPITPSDLCLVANATIDKASLREERGHRTATFEKIAIDLNACQPADEVNFNIKAHGAKDNEANTVLITGKLRDLADETGQWNLSKASAELSANIEKLPILVAAAAIGAREETQGKMEAIFGDRLDAIVGAKIRQLEGPIKIQLQGVNSKALLDGALKQGFLILNKPLTGEVAVTPLLSKLVLKDINPLLITAVGSEQPITLTVEPEGFRWPIMPFDKLSTDIGNAKLDLGKITLTNGGPLGAVLGILKAHKLAAEKHSSIWFTPQYISLHRGNLVIKRMDYLIAESFHLATWGTIDWPSNRVKMIIGLSAQTMRKAFGIKIDKGQMFQITMSGTTDKIHVDTTKTATRLAALIAQHKAGTAGEIIGKLVDTRSVTLGDEPVPPPTTQPFPWEQDPKIKKKMTEEQEKSIIPDVLEDIKKPEKVIKKEAEKLLKKVFK